MLVFPNCKINLGLHITGKRADGYHSLETIFYPVPFCDALEVIASVNAEEATPRLSFSSSGLPVPGDPAANLCVKAFELLRTDFPQLPAVQMHLHKIIPTGAGLGGGSGNGAFALTLLNQKFGLGLTRQQLLTYALRLGSDCPFFIVNEACLATGRGEQLRKITLSLAGYHLVLVTPPIHISTAKAFSGIVPGQPEVPLEQIVSHPLQSWKGTLVNHFEPVIYDSFPELAVIKEKLYEAGAVYASLTGTGSTVYGIFTSPPASLHSIASKEIMRTFPL